MAAHCKFPAPDIPLDQPWLQLKGEGNEAYAAFCVYRDMGRDRSIDAAYRQQLSNKRATPVSDLAMRASGRWTAWSTVFDWARRALAYDRHLDSIRHSGRDWLIARNGIDWAREREQDVRERLETYRNLRRGLMQLTAAGAVVDTSKRYSYQDEDGRWISSQEKLQLSNQFRILRELQKTLFPPDEMELVDPLGNRYSKFEPPESIVLFDPDAEPETGEAAKSAGQSE
jgi:hypothetical protein